jgi:hypothetical protein
MAKTNIEKAHYKKAFEQQKQRKEDFKIITSKARIILQTQELAVNLQNRI